MLTGRNDRLTCLRGGLPLMVEGQYIGTIGVSGGPETDDAVIAQAGVDSLARFAI